MPLRMCAMIREDWTKRSEWTRIEPLGRWTVLIIRDSQMQAFATMAARDFEQTALAHLHQNLPEACAELGDAAVRDSIQLAVRKCAEYQFQTVSETLRYLNIMYWVGFHFDEDPQCPWAQEILNNEDLEIEDKLDALEQAALRELAAEESS